MADPSFVAITSGSTLTYADPRIANITCSSQVMAIRAPVMPIACASPLVFSLTGPTNKLAQFTSGSTITVAFALSVKIISSSTLTVTFAQQVITTEGTYAGDVYGGGADAVNVPIGQATETDTTNSLTPILGAATVLMGQALETDTAYPLTVVTGVTVPLGQVVETDTAQPMTSIGGAVAQTIPLGQAVETDLANPIVLPGMLSLTGTSGSFTIPAFDTSTTITALYSPSTDGVLTMQVTNPAGWLPIYTVKDADGQVVQIDDDGVLDVVWAAGEQMTITIIQTGQPTANVTFTWAYAARASSALVVDLDRDYLYQTPGGLIASISNGQPNEPVYLSLIGTSTINNFQTITLDLFGNYDQAMIDLPAVDAGSYYLRATGGYSGAEDVAFTIQANALDTSNTPKPIDTPPTRPVNDRWQFFDLRDPDVLNYEFTRNPKSWTNVFPPNSFSHDKTTAPDGAPLTWQAAARPWQMEFSGFLDTEEEFNDLSFWAQLRRRFWLIDHRNRAWLITIEHFDAQAQVKPNLPWAHEYTMKTLVFMQGTDQD